MSKFRFPCIKCLVKNVTNIYILFVTNGDRSKKMKVELQQFISTAFIYLSHIIRRDFLKCFIDFRLMIPVKGSQLNTFCLKAVFYCYLEFKLCYLKKLKLFSIKELFEPIVLLRKCDRFLFF